MVYNITSFFGGVFMNVIVQGIRADKMCRTCINRRYGSSLRREHCNYWQYPGKCTSCGEVRNIVADVVWWQRWRLWRIKKK